MTDYDELARKARGATPGPWHVGEVRTYGVFPEQDPDDEGALASVRHWEPSLAPKSEQDAANAAYIASASPDVILALLEERKVLRGLMPSLISYALAGPTNEASREARDDAVKRARAALQAEPAREGAERCPTCGARPAPNNDRIARGWDTSADPWVRCGDKWHSEGTGAALVAAQEKGETGT